MSSRAETCKLLDALEIDRLRKRVVELEAVICTPENNEFLKGVAIEAEYQRQKHGVDTTDGRFDWHQWFWVVGYLLGKALAACRNGSADNGEKAKHHLVTTAALIYNWHNVLIGMPAASVHSQAGEPVARSLLEPFDGK